MAVDIVVVEGLSNVAVTVFINQLRTAWVTLLEGRHIQNGALVYHEGLV